MCSVVESSCGRYLFFKNDKKTEGSTWHQWFCEYDFIKIKKIQNTIDSVLALTRVSININVGIGVGVHVNVDIGVGINSRTSPIRGDLGSIESKAVIPKLQPTARVSKSLEEWRCNP